MVVALLIVAGLGVIAFMKYSGRGEDRAWIGVGVEDGSGDADRPKGYPTETQAAVRNAKQRADTMPLKLEPAMVNLGKHTPCDPDLKTKVTVTNQSQRPVTIKRIMASCACASAELEGARLIAPGESRTLNISIDLNGSGDKSQSIYMTEDGPPIGTVRVDYQLRSPVKTTKEAIDISPEHPSAEVTVVREDGKPVKLLSLIPDIGVIKTNADGTQVVVIDTERADRYADSEEGKSDGSVHRDADGTWAAMYVAVVTDYPGCPNASVFVRRGR